MKIYSNFIFRIHLIGLMTMLTVACVHQKSIDLTDVSLKNISQPLPGIVSGGQPSVQDLDLLAKRGLKNVVNLRGEGEFDGFDEVNAAKTLQLNYVALPISGGADVTIENAKILNQQLAQLQGETLVHCASGNRAGALLALRAGLFQGADIEQALQIGRAAGMTSLETKTREILESQVKQ